MKLLDEANISKIASAYGKATQRLILLDYDGTLVGFTDHPSHAIPGDKVLELLRKIAEDEKNAVVIISGRDKKTLDAWLGELNIMMIAEHGVSIKWKDRGWEKQHDIQAAWKDHIRPLMQQFVNSCQGSMMEEKENTLTWHYRNTKADLGIKHSRELLNALNQLLTADSLQVIDGNKVLEVRQSGIDKGSASLKLLEIISPDFVLCIGDDTTDEDMFRALSKQAFTIKVGNGSTAAQFKLLNQDDVFPVLERIVNNSATKNQKSKI
ncbi:MAG TPA: trehalose-phosphatase [Chitinophagaceae bacterium]|nr:trehalose-phosphatase [Chitinophagaceae bacterium]